jgi:hypothetical protein
VVADGRIPQTFDPNPGWPSDALELSVPPHAPARTHQLIIVDRRRPSHPLRLVRTQLDMRVDPALALALPLEVDEPRAPRPRGEHDEVGVPLGAVDAADAGARAVGGEEEGGEGPRGAKGGFDAVGAERAGDGRKGVARGDPAARGAVETSPALRRGLSASARSCAIDSEPIPREVRK